MKIPFKNGPFSGDIVLGGVEAKAYVSKGNFPRGLIVRQNWSLLKYDQIQVRINDIQLFFAVCRTVTEGFCSLGDVDNTFRRQLVHMLLYTWLKNIQQQPR